MQIMTGVDEKKREARAVREMFAGIAPAYDFLNHLLSLNIDKRWRKRVCKRLRDIIQDPKAIILDVACGTGDLAIQIKKSGQARVIGADFCRPMLKIAERKNQHIKYVEADALTLPFEDEFFDAVTIAFGLRNFSDWERGLCEVYRVTKPSGRLVVLEFSTPVLPGFQQLFNFYFRRILPSIGGLISGAKFAYEYLPRSVANFPNQEKLAEMMRKVGFKQVEYENLTGGIAAIHVARK